MVPLILGNPHRDHGRVKAKRYGPSNVVPCRDPASELDLWPRCTVLVVTHEVSEL